MRVFIVLTLIIISTVGIYLGIINHSEKEFDYSKWNTYTNDRYGFEFKYPQEWVVVNTGNDGPIVSVAPNGYGIGLGKGVPYGYFYVYPLDQKELQRRKVKDTGWYPLFEGMLNNNGRTVISDDGKFDMLIFSPTDESKDEIEKIIESFVSKK